MKIFLVCSKTFYGRVPNVLTKLEAAGHTVTLPNSYDDPAAEERHKNLSQVEHAKWKAGMLARSREIIRGVDAVLVLNFEKKGIENYIGGATFLEMYDAYTLGKKIYLYNPIPEGMLADEIASFSPVIINGELDRVK